MAYCTTVHRISPLARRGKVLRFLLSSGHFHQSYTRLLRQIRSGFNRNHLLEPETLCLFKCRIHQVNIIGYLAIIIRYFQIFSGAIYSEITTVPILWTTSTNLSAIRTMTNFSIRQRLKRKIWRHFWICFALPSPYSFDKFLLKYVTVSILIPFYIYFYLAAISTIFDTYLTIFAKLQI